MKAQESEWNVHGVYSVKWFGRNYRGSQSAADALVILCRVGILILFAWLFIRPSAEGSEVGRQAGPRRAKL